MYLSKLKKMIWLPYQITKGSADTGTVVMRALEKIKGHKTEERSYMVEIGWFILKKINEPARLIVNEKHFINCSFDWNVDPDEPVSWKEFIESLPWREAVAKTLPEDAFK